MLTHRNTQKCKAILGCVTDTQSHTDTSQIRHALQTLPDMPTFSWIDWFWLQGWLMNKRAICTGTAPLFWKFIFLFERPRTRLVRKTGSPNQSMGLVTQKWVTSHMSESWSTLMICVAQEWVTSQTRNALLTLPDLPTFSWMSHVTHEWVISHMNESCSTLMSRVAQERVASYTHSATMGWLRLVGCLKIYVSLQNIGLFCRSLLQKRPIFLSILLIVATP